MKIDHVTVCVSDPTPEVGALLAAIAAGFPIGGLSAPTADACTVASTPQPKAAPLALRIGDPWPSADGIYAGLARGRDGEPDGHLVLLNVKPEGKLNWADAKAWAEGRGDGARLPSRLESALLYANLQEHFETDDWHWTGTQYAAGGAWGQYFGDGYQGSLGKSFEARARAVRRFPA